MSTVPSWLKSAAIELEELVGRPVAGADAWRALSLAGRLKASGRAFDDVLGPLAAAWDEWVAKVAWPDGGELLEELAVELEAAGPEDGPLLDLLLDLDDLVGILSALGRGREADDLGLRAAALCACSPDRVLPLGPFSDMRLSCLAAGASSAPVWESIQEAALEPALLYVESRGRRKTERAPLPRRLVLAAAQSSEPASADLLRTSDGTGVGWIELDPQSGRRQLEIPSGAAEVRSVVVWARSRRTGEARRLELPFEVVGNDVYADLGHPAGPGSLAEWSAALDGDFDLEVEVVRGPA
jgi:hypothetical protein